MYTSNMQYKLSGDSAFSDEALEVGRSKVVLENFSINMKEMNCKIGVKG